MKRTFAGQLPSRTKVLEASDVSAN